MKWIRFFDNFEGRIPRKTFWLANIAVFIIEVIVTALIAAAVDELAGQTAGDVATHILTLAFFYPQFVIALKRAHDLDMSSQIIYAWYVALAVNYGVIRFAPVAVDPFQSECFFIGRAGICLCVHLRRRHRQP